MSHLPKCQLCADINSDGIWSPFHCRFLFWVLIPLFTVVPMSAHGQDRATPKPFYIQGRITPSFTLPSDLKKGGGEMDTAHYDFSATLMIPRGPGARFNLNLARELHHYDFSGTERLDGLLRSAHETKLNAVYMGPLTSSWSLFAMMGVRWAGEDRASEEDTRTQMIQVMGQHQLSPDFQWGLGLMVSSRLDDDVQIIPIPSISWNITDRISLRTTRGLHLGYQWDEAGRWRSYLNVEYHGKEFRLNSDGPAPNAVYRQRLAVTSLAMDYKPNPGMSFAAEIGYIPWREVRIDDSNGAELFRSEVDPGFSAAVSASIMF